MVLDEEHPTIRQVAVSTLVGGPVEIWVGLQLGRCETAPSSECVVPLEPEPGAVDTELRALEKAATVSRCSFVTRHPSWTRMVALMAMGESNGCTGCSPSCACQCSGSRCWGAFLGRFGCSGTTCSLRTCDDVDSGVAAHSWVRVRGRLRNLLSSWGRRRSCVRGFQRQLGLRRPVCPFPLRRPHFAQPAD
jgi:hypothetical protein